MAVAADRDPDADGGRSSARVFWVDFGDATIRSVPK
jgi:hypothetical protein